VWDEEWRFAFSCSPSSRKARNRAQSDRAVGMADSTVECISVEGRAAPVADAARVDHWVDLYMARYPPSSPDLSEEFIRSHHMLEFTPDRAFAVIESPDEFADRATRWVFD